MKAASPQVDPRQLITLLAGEYGIRVAELRFVPKGEEAYAYAGYAAGQPTVFVRLQPAVSAGDLERVYLQVHALRYEHGLTSVVAPVATRHGSFTLPLRGFALAVFPFVTANTLYERPVVAADARDAASVLAQLHQEPPALPHLAWERFANLFAQPIRRRC